MYYQGLSERLRQEAMDPETAVILFDVVLGPGTNEAPVEEMTQPLKYIQESKKPSEAGPVLCAFVCGTENDLQSSSRQCDELEKLGVKVFSSSTESARVVASILENKNG